MIGNSPLLSLNCFLTISFCGVGFFFSYSPFQGVNRFSRSPRLKLRSQFDFQLLKDFASFVGPLILKTPDHQRPADTYKTVCHLLSAWERLWIYAIYG